MDNYLADLITPSVAALQEHKGSADLYDTATEGPAGLTDDEIAHISAADSFYMATVGESGWPYVQHKGGDPGFVTVLGPTSIGWLERLGNRQYIGTGNLTADDRLSLIFVDYPNRTRLKVRGRATHHADPSPDLVAALGGTGVRNDGAVVVEIAATAWNCPKFITPRYTADQVEAAIETVTGDLRARIAELEAQLAVAG